jgi:gliding motility-associated-like protein
VSITAQTNVLCFGGTTGSATATAAGGSSPYDYVWTGTSGTLQTTNNIAGADVLNGLAAGTYTVNITDNNGCLSNTSVTITQPSSALAVSITGSTPATCGASNGSATALASGGTSPYDYVWAGTSGTLQTTNNITTSNTLSSLAAGTYTITITDNNSCTASTTVTIGSTAGATVSITAQTNVLCFGGTTGSATATAAGGSSPYDYVWSGTSGTLQTTNNIAGADVLNGLAAGTYTVNVTDNNGCLSSATVTITQPSAALAVSITGSTPASCGASNGDATALASGGTSPYDYVWTGTSGTLQTTNNITVANTLSALAAGTYTVTITDNNNCTASTTVTISNSGGATTTITGQTNILCFGGTTGNATATTTGGASPYDFVWVGSSGTLQTTNNIMGPDIINGLGAGTYTVNVTDNSGCLSSTSVTITQPATALTVSITGTTPASCGASNGDATALATGGTSPYDYVWTGASGTLQTTNNITTADNLSSLAAGTYTVTITDNNSCTASTTVTVTSTGGASVSITAQTNVLCFGDTTGSAIATATGGSSPYDYSWSNASGALQTTMNINGADTLSGLAAGTYSVSVTDNNGCVSLTSVTITEPTSAVSVAITGSTNTACGLSNGDATALASGGSGPYDYVWTGASGTLLTTNNISTSNTITTLAAGSYTVTITDNNGCTTFTTVSISSTGGATVTTTQTDVLCFGGLTGSITATAAGGASPYDYVWTGTAGTLQTTNNIVGSDVLNGLGAGTYTVTVTDNSGCISNTNVTITQPASAASVTITGTTPAGCGMSNGSATAQAAGGTGPYDYVWSNASGTLLTTNNISGPNTLNAVASGTYTITITDNNNCTSSITATITNSGGATTTISSSVNVLCYGGATGSATATTAGGSSPYDYIWTGTTGTVHTDVNITTPSSATGLTAGTYTVSVTDNGGCVSTTTVTISQPASALTASSGSIIHTSCGLNNGSATVTANGGTPGYTYNWSPAGGSGSTASGLTAGTYIVTTTDLNGCTTTATAVINVSSGITASAVTATNVTCFGGTNGSATATGSGGTGTYSYSWTPSGGSAATAIGLAAGTYTVTVVNGTCSTTTTAIITQPSVIVASITTTPAACGSTTGTGTATIGAAGGTGTLSYLWSNGGTGTSISSLNSGSVGVTVTDASGCTQTATGIVGITGALAVDAGVSTTIPLGSNTTLVGTGSADWTYTWSPPGTLECPSCSATTATPIVVTTYTLTVTSGGCTGSDTVTINIDYTCGELFVPTAFSPNGDGNENDVLKVYGKCITNLNFAIFDRWGEKVFETSDPAIGWDGTYKGKKLDTAVFVYYLTATWNGTEVKQHGNITLVK